MKSSLKNLIQSKISSELGLNVKLEYTKDGDLKVFRTKRVVPRNPLGTDQISLSDARMIGDYKVGGYVEEEIHNGMVDHIVARAIRESEAAEKEIAKRRVLTDTLLLRGITDHSLIFATYKGMSPLGEFIFNFPLEGSDIRVGIAPNDAIPGESFETGKDYPMIISSMEKKNEKIVFSATRTSSLLVEELIYSLTVDLKQSIKVVKVARIAGKKTKVIVSSPESENPCALVVGKGGSKIAKLESYLSGGEKVEVVNYSKSTPIQIKNLIGENNFINMYFDFECPSYFDTLDTLNNKKILVVVPDDKIGKVVGKGGSSLCLTDKLSGWVIRVMAETEFAEKFKDGFISQANPFEWCGVEIPSYLATFYGHYLYQLGYKSVVECRELDISDLEPIKRFTASDKEFILDFIKGLSFVVECPSCGASIEYGAEVCPECGCNLEY